MNRPMPNLTRYPSEHADATRRPQTVTTPSGKTMTLTGGAVREALRGRTLTAASKTPPAPANINASDGRTLMLATLFRAVLGEDVSGAAVDAAAAAWAQGIPADSLSESQVGDLIQSARDAIAAADLAAAAKV